jgi:hypothetical protein
LHEKRLDVVRTTAAIEQLRGHAARSVRIAAHQLYLFTEPPQLSKADWQ